LPCLSLNYNPMYSGCWLQNAALTATLPEGVTIVALNRDGPRFSSDIAIFQDSEEHITTAAESDAAALTEAGLKLTWLKTQTGRRNALIEELGEKMQLEWVADSDFRFSLPCETISSAMCCIRLT